VIFLEDDEEGDVPNPLASDAVATYVEPAFQLLLAIVVLCLLAAVLSAILRFRRSSGQARLQMKWFAYAVAVGAALSLSEEFVPEEISRTGFMHGAGLSLLIGSIGVAVLRYRLYDIDRIINRTLVYVLLTAFLAAVYFGLVVGLQAMLRSVSGGSDFAVVLTTLAVAGLFLPARRRLQDAVDRRFNRRAYDGARTIEAFGARLRQQVDLDTLRYELLSVVDETMQPGGAALWLMRR
jgi:hypothetical protein